MIRLASRTDLAKLIPPHGRGAELGVYRGQFSAKLLQHARPAKLFLVDRWSDGPDFVAKVQAADALAEVRRRFQDNAAVEIVQGDVLQWLSSQANNTLDWIYLDDTHTVEHLVVELAWAFDKVKPGGLLCGHDYCCALPQVVWAVDGFCRDQGQTIHYLTRERKYPVWPRLPWQPKRCAYESFGIVVQKPAAKIVAP